VGLLQKTAAIPFQISSKVSQSQVCPSKNTYVAERTVITREVPRNAIGLGRATQAEKAGGREEAS